MIKILMTVYGLTAEQAAARAPAAQFVLTAVVAAVFVWLDSNGTFDGVGRWMGRKLREVLDPRTDAEAGYPDPPVCPICHQRCDTIYRAEDGTIVGCDHCLEATDAWKVNEFFPEKE